MTPHELRTQFENLISDSHDITHTYQLLTQAKNKIETMLKLKVLENTDTTQIWSPGDTYTTLKTIPSDFRQMLRLFIGRYEAWPVSSAEKVRFQNAARRYYIDHKRQVAGLTALGIMGSTGSGQTISQVYQVTTADLTEDNEDTAGVILWPAEFQPIIPYVAARVFQANIDPDDISVRQAIAQDREAQDLLDAMIAWDQDIKLAAMGNQGGYASEVDDDDHIPVGML